MANFKSVLAAIGGDVKKVFAWIGSPAGQASISAVEATAVAIDPALSGLFSLANTYIAEAVKTEALAAGAAAQTGTGAQKLSAVIAAVTPAALQYATQAKLPAPTAAEISTAANGIVAFLNAFSAGSSPAV
jgi:hypothetical protein